MSEIKNDGLDQYGAGPFEQQQFRTAGDEGVNILSYQTHNVYKCAHPGIKRRGPGYENAGQASSVATASWTSSDVGQPEVKGQPTVNRLTISSVAQIGMVNSKIIDLFHVTWRDSNQSNHGRRTRWITCILYRYVDVICSFEDKIEIKTYFLSGKDITLSEETILGSRSNTRRWMNRTFSELRHLHDKNSVAGLKHFYQIIMTTLATKHNIQLLVRRQWNSPRRVITQNTPKDNEEDAKICYKDIEIPKNDTKRRKKDGTKCFTVWNEMMMMMKFPILACAENPEA